MKCSVCGCESEKPFISYDNQTMSICSYLCTKKTELIKFERIDNIEDFNEPRPVIETKFHMLTNKEIQKLTNIRRDKYDRRFLQQLDKDPIKIQEEYRLIHLLSDSESDESEPESDDYDENDE